MKKIYYIIIGITIAMFLYWVVSSLPALLTKFTIVTQNSIGNSSFSSSGSFAYKSTPERTDLIEEMISINSDFIKNPPVPFPEEKNTIKNFYKLTKCFPNFKTYYIAKLKVTDTLFNELPVLLNATSSLTELELQKYFNSNTKYLGEKWGVNNFNDFYEVVLTIKQLNGKEIASYALEESYFYMPKLGTTNFRIIITPNDNDIPVYIAGIAEVYNKSDYQDAPVIKFLGTVLGGIS